MFGLCCVCGKHRTVYMGFFYFIFFFVFFFFHFVCVCSVLADSGGASCPSSNWQKFSRHLVLRCFMAEEIHRVENWYRRIELWCTFDAVKVNENRTREETIAGIVVEPTERTGSSGEVCLKFETVIGHNRKSVSLTIRVRNGNHSGSWRAPRVEIDLHWEGMIDEHSKSVTIYIFIGWSIFSSNAHFIVLNCWMSARNDVQQQQPSKPLSQLPFINSSNIIADENTVVPDDDELKPD